MGHTHTRLSGRIHTAYTRMRITHCHLRRGKIVSRNLEKANENDGFKNDCIRMFHLRVLDSPPFVGVVFYPESIACLLASFSPSLIMQ